MKEIRFGNIPHVLPFSALGYSIGSLFQVTDVEMMLFVIFFSSLSFISSFSIPAVGISFFSSLATWGTIGFLPIVGSEMIRQHPLFIPLAITSTFVIYLPWVSKASSNYVKSMKPLSGFMLNSLILLFVAPFAFFYSRGGDRFALNLLVNSGEDNAAWLENISAGTLESTQATFTNQYSDGSGEPFGILLNLVHNVFIQAKGSEAVITDSPRILLISYGLILIMGLLASLGTLLVAFCSQHGSLLFTFMLSIPLFLTIYFGWVSFAHLGHLPAAFSFMTLLCAMSFCLKTLNNSRKKVFAVTATGAMLLSAGVTWLPLLPVSLVSISVFVGVLLYKYKHSNVIQMNRSKVILFSTSALTLILMLKSMYELASGIDLAYFKFLIHAQGATVDPFGLPIVLALIGFTWLSSRLISSKQVISDLVMIFIVVFSSYTILITVLSLVTTPFQLDYASKKLALLLTYVGLVFLVYGSGVVISTLDLQVPVVYLGLLTLLSGAVFLSPGPKFSYPISIANSSVSWVSSGLDQMKKYPQTPVVCLNTSTGNNAASFDVYFCNRILGALQASKNEEVRAWAMRSLQEEWSPNSTESYEQFEKNGLAVLVTDISRTSTDNDSQKVFVNSIPLGTLRYIPM